MLINERFDLFKLCEDRTFVSLIQSIKLNFDVITEVPERYSIYT